MGQNSQAWSWVAWKKERRRFPSENAISCHIPSFNTKSYISLQQPRTDFYIGIRQIGEQPATTAGHSGPDLGWDRVSVSLSLSLSLSLDPLLPTSCAHLHHLGSPLHSCCRLFRSESILATSSQYRCQDPPCGPCLPCLLSASNNQSQHVRLPPPCPCCQSLAACQLP